MAASTYIRFIQRVAPTVLRSKAGQRIAGAIALVFDSLSEGSRQATRASWVGDADTGPAYDALGPAGAELSLPRYPNETWQQYHARLQRAWTDWPLAGHESIIIENLAALGYPGARIFYNAGTSASWSEFTVFYAHGLHHVGKAPLIGTFTIGDGTVIGPTNITPIEIHTLKAIVRKFKPGHWVCRAVIFELSGWIIGTGHVIGETDLVIGGDAVYLDLRS